MIRTGVDLVSVARITEMIRIGGDRFLRASWTRAEQRTCAGDAQRLAARWAAKEATMKVLGEGVDVVPLTDVEVGTGASGAPELLLHGVARRLAHDAGLVEWSVSLSHEGDLAVGLVVAVGGFDPVPVRSLA